MYQNADGLFQPQKVQTPQLNNKVHSHIHTNVKTDIKHALVKD